MSEQDINKIPVQNSSSSRPRLLKVRSEPCFIGEPELKVAVESNGSISSSGELLLLEHLSRDSTSPNSQLPNSSSCRPGDANRILVTEYSLDTNESLELDYSCLFNGAFKAVIAPFFGMQVLSLASKCGVLLVPLPIPTIGVLRERLARSEDKTLAIDLTSQVIETHDNVPIEFKTAPWHRNRLLNGMDDTDEVLALKAAREDYLESDKKRRPWLYS